MRRRRSRRFPSSTKQPLSASPLPEAVVPPVPAAELPLIPEVTETPKVPFWKKEISLGGKKGDSKPKPQKEKKGRKRKGSEAAPVVDEAPTVSVPAPEDVVHPPVPAAELPPLPDETAKVPFWKKEIGGKKGDRKPKEKKERKPKASKEERAAETKEPKPAQGAQAEGSEGQGGTRRQGSEGDHRPEDRCIPARCSARLEQRQRRAPAGCARAARAGDRRRRRAARPGRSCRSTEGILREERTPEARRPARPRKQQDRRPHVRDLRDHRPEAARKRGPLPGPGGAADSDRRGGARLPGAR